MPRKPPSSPKVKTALYVDADVYEALKRIADHRDTPISRIIRRALSEFVERNPTKK